MNQTLVEEFRRLTRIAEEIEPDVERVMMVRIRASAREHQRVLAESRVASKSRVVF
jgi:hypothetical protein